MRDNPEELLRCMCIYNVVISGSRAAEYFSPGLAMIDSDWDFYIGDNEQSVLVFMYCLTRMGVQWEHAGSNDFDCNKLHYNGLKFNCIKGTINHNNTSIGIQPIMYKPLYGSPLRYLSAFHSTIVQCYISGASAVCMYSDLTSNHKSLSWLYRANHFSTTMKKLDYWHLNMGNKYEVRGVKYITYDEYNNYANIYIKGSSILDSTRYRKSMTLCHIGSSFIISY